MSGNHAHVHSTASHQNEKRLWIALSLTSAFLIAEIIAGFLTNSLALLSDAAHMFTDVCALAISLVAMGIAKRFQDTRRTFGYHRFEILAAAFNSILLFLVAIYILYEAFLRFKTPADIHTTGMLIVATFGWAVNIASIRLLQGGKDESLNIKSAYLEVWSDMLGSIGVIVAALTIYFTGWAWMDSLIALAIGMWVLPRTWVLLKETLNVLLEGVPKGMDIKTIQIAMCKIPGILNLHDFHLWAISSNKVSLTAHIVYDGAYSSEKQLLPALRMILEKEFSIHHTTFQFETNPCMETNKDIHCHYLP
ncbi:MAG: cation diffusion facilitator family transporter [Gammaproteobacteria bacterium]|nr:cation diffusion facilitator family transporter [Gammaproteobacteria bacterium]MCD8543040.1 cation diffusion facilitator family transporter [Gammaproteobacteria bacterium]